MIIHFCIIYISVLTVTVKSQLERKIVESFSSPADQYEDLVHVVVHILKECIDRRPDHSVIIGSCGADELYFLNKISSTTPVRLVKRDENAIEDRYVKFNILNANVRTSKVPANNFIIVFSTRAQLLASLRSLKTSYWWNHSGFFLLTNKNVENGCEDAGSLLLDLWAFNVLSAILMCYNSANEVEMYTFNPYNQFAPKIWSVVDVNRKSKNHPWRLFKQSWRTSVNYSDAKFCESLIFDKTTRLNNYPLQLAAYLQSNLLRYDGAKVGWSRFEGVNSDIVGAICTHLNASVNFTFYDRIGSLDDDGEFQGFFRDLSAGTVDFAMNMNLQRFYWKFQTYPHENAGFCIVSLKHSNSFYYKFRTIFTAQWWLLLGFTFIFTIFILKFLMHQSPSLAAMEFLRMLLNVSTVENPPVDIPRRIVFLEAVLLMMVLNTFFQSRLSSIAVAPNTRPMVETLAELVSSRNVAIYGTLQFNELLEGTQVARERYNISNYSDCAERLGRRERVVCLPGCIEARYSIFESDDYHIAKDSFRSFFMVFSSRVDWPLLGRFNRIIRYMAEGGFIRLFRNRELKYYLQDTKFDQVKKLDSKNLKFGFDIFFFGIISGSCIFCMEIGCYHLKLKFREMTGYRMMMRIKNILILRNKQTE